MFRNRQTDPMPVAIIGAGPVGLAAAAELTLKDEPWILLEAGPRVGTAPDDWGHVRLFSPWRYNLSAAAVSLLEEGGQWTAPDPEALPTGRDLRAEYLEPLASLPKLAPHIHLDSRVVAVGREGVDKTVTPERERRPFLLRVEQGGVVRSVRARAVIDASGTWMSGSGGRQSNPLGAGGVPAEGEMEARPKIFYGIPDPLDVHRHRYAGRRVLVVGGGHSAVHSVLSLAELRRQVPQTRVVWALRRNRPDRAYGGGEGDALPARGALGTEIRRLVEKGEVELVAPFRLSAVAFAGPTGSMDVQGEADSGAGSVVIRGVDEVIANTGSRPEFSFLREVRVDRDSALECVPALAPLIDPNVHSCGTVRPHGERELRQPEPDFYVVGSKSYGRAPTFLMATGYEQVRSVVAALTGDQDGAERVELNLPETGVCGALPAAEPSTSVPAAPCCGPEAGRTTACC